LRRYVDVSLQQICALFSMISPSSSNPRRSPEESNVRKLGRLLIISLAVSAYKLLSPPVALAQTTPFVFAHYHLPYCVGVTGGCPSTAAGLQAAYTNDITNAIALGIDGFALNAGSWISQENRYPANVAAFYAAADAYNAAHGTNFKLFVSPDLSGGASYWTQSDFVNLLNKYCSDPAQLTVHGKCVLSGWNIDTGYNGAQYRSMFAASNVGASGVFFVPGFNGQGTSTALGSSWLPYIDGVFAFDCCATNSINASGGNGTSITQAVSYAAAIRAAGNGYNGFPLIYMAGTTTHYWETASSYNWYMETNGFLGLENYWNQIIQTTKPDWVEAFTWSDVGESWEAPVTGLSNFQGNSSPQGGGTALQAYYIQWLKTGVQPPIVVDQLYYSYRVNPAAMSCTGHVEGKVAGGVPVLDDVYVTTLLAPGNSATLTVNAGAGQQTNSVGPGITNTGIPFLAPATPSFTLTRDGVTEISLTGPPITNLGGPCNFYPVTGVGFSNGYTYPPYALGALTLAPSSTLSPSPTTTSSTTPTSPTSTPPASPSPTSTPTPAPTPTPTPTLRGF
jgi:Glycosyl hydrolase family 71